MDSPWSLLAEIPIFRRRYATFICAEGDYNRKKLKEVEVKRTSKHRSATADKNEIAKERRQLVERAMLHLLFVGLGALCTAAELVFGVRPFGIALVAGTTQYFPAASAGVLLFSLLRGDRLSLVALGLLVGLRGAITLWSIGHRSSGAPFTERVAYRVTGAAVSVFVTGVYRVFGGGFRFYDLFALMLVTAAAALAALLYCGLFEERDRLFAYSRETGLAALVLTGIFAMRTVSFFGVYPAAVAAALCAFLLVAHRGISWGAVGGALAGLCFDYRMAPALLLCAIAFGLLEKSSRGGGILAGSGAAAIWAFAVARSEGIMLILPAMLTAGALFLAGDSAGLVEGSPAYRQILRRRRAAAFSARAGEQAENESRLREISGAFLDLSGTFFELSNRLRRPSMTELRRLCDRAFDEVCPGCRHRDVCWGSEYRSTAETVGALGGRLHSHGVVTAEQVPAALTARCADLPRILKSINAGAVRLTDESLRGDRTSVVATDYAAMGRILSETLEEGKEAFTADGALGERITDRLQRLGYSIGAAVVCGKRHRRVILHDIRLPGRHLKIRELRKILEQHCHFALGEAVSTESEGVLDLTFPERTLVRSVTVKETRAKGKESRHCGDSVAALSTARGYDYALLCDGMGSGNGAALTSALASAFLSRMLQAGSRADTALRMLNGFLASRGTRETEASTTVDLLEIDRISGEASLFKCGAAPTYLLREGQLTRFFSRTAPVGILESLDAERIRFQLKPGDVLVQVSDGITGGEEECAWLAEMLTTRYDGDAEKLTRLVLNRASERGQDDLSVLVTEITAAPLPGEAQAA